VRAIVRHGLNVICSSAANDHDDDGSNGGEATRPVDHQIGSNTTRPNQGSWLINAICVPVEMRYHADLYLLNEAH
jgi:hypothetical protein